MRKKSVPAIDEGLGERYRYIEPMAAHESFRIMEDFAASLPESAIKTRLIEALSCNKPFGRFKNIVHSDFALRGQWFIFRDDAFARYASDWLEAVGIQADLQRRKQ